MVEVAEVLVEAAVVVLVGLDNFVVFKFSFLL